MKIIRIIFTILLVGRTLFCSATEIIDDSLTVVSGIVKEKFHKKKLAGVTLSIPGSNIATVTNSDGSFSIKLPAQMLGRGIKAQHMGFRSTLVEGERLKKDFTCITIWLEPSSKVLEEITVYGAQPRTLIELALKKIPENYPASPNMFSSFYRETIQKGRRYIGVSEAIMNVFKKSYKTRRISGDRVQVIKGRRLMSQRKNDTLAVKIIGGPTLPVVLDIVKNDDVLFNLSELDFYEFKMEPMTSLDERRQFVVSFKPIVTVDYPLHKGKVYIDQETMSFTRAEFSLDVSDKEKATKAILYKKPRGLHFKPQELEIIVTYKFQDGISYLNYIRTKTRFRCDWKRRLFSSGYTTYAEMVMVDRDDNPSDAIPRKDAFGSGDIFYDKVDNFSDKDFWKEYNIIEPTESLEKAVLRLRN